MQPARGATSSKVNVWKAASKAARSLDGTIEGLTERSARLAYGALIESWEDAEMLQNANGLSHAR